MTTEENKYAIRYLYNKLFRAWYQTTDDGMSWQLCKDQKLAEREANKVDTQN